MQLLYYAPKLTAPTFESLRFYADQRFRKLTRFAPKLSSDNHIRISVEKEGHNFVLSVEIPFPGKPVYIQVAHPNMYAAIDQAYDVLKRTLRKTTERRMDRRRKGR